MMKDRRSVLLAALLLPLILSCEKIPFHKTEPDVIFVATPPRVASQMLKLAGVNQTDTVYDLGSGDGRIVIAAARDFGARGVGVEIDPKLVVVSNEYAAKAGVSDRVRFVQQDLFKTELREASVVTLYLLPDLMERLIPRFLKDLKPGTRIVSHTWEMGDWKPDVAMTGYGSTIYLWLVPPDVRGTWRIAVASEKGGKEYTLEMEQTFQKVKGILREGGRKVRLTDLRLYGKEIVLRWEEPIAGGEMTAEMEGSVEGDVITGTMVLTGTGTTPVTATWKGERTMKRP